MAEATIHNGLWIDWSKGRIFGGTLTTTATQRGLLVAFVAVFVATAGGSLWQILNFLIHRARLIDQAQVSYSCPMTCELYLNSGRLRSTSSQIAANSYCQNQKDGLFNQQQAVLRNASSPAVAAWKQLELSWFWRNRARRRSIRPMPYIFLALLYLVTLEVTSVFSSRVSRSTSTVLVRSP